MSHVSSTSSNGHHPRLHLGCFHITPSGWVNTDITPHIWIARIPMLAPLLYRAGLMPKERYMQHRSGVFRKARYMNVTKRFPYRESTFEAVYSSHLLEHLFHDQAMFSLCEMHRVLLPGGICRIVVPDLDAIVRDYDPSNPDTFLMQVFEFRARQSDKNLHHWLYNSGSLSKLCREVGFREVHECAFGEGRCPDLELLDNRADTSIYIEAVK